MERTVIPVEGLTQFHPLPGIVMRDPWLTMCSNEPGRVLAWFNNSSVVHNGKRWMTYRTECKRWFLWSKINLVQLDSQFNPIPGTNTLLPLHTRFDGWGAEDARLFIFDGRLHLTYGDGYRVLLAELDDNGKVIRNAAIPTDEKDQNPPQKHPREKNWGFFEFDGRLFCQHGVNPTVTFEFDLVTWTVSDRWSSTWRWSSPFGVRLHGGSSPIFHDGYLWRWVHCHRSEKLPVARNTWFSDKLQHTGHRYYPHLACFNPEPPFAPVEVSSVPVFHSEWEPKHSDGPTHYSVAYVGSAEREADGWRLFYGENDCRVITAQISDEIATRSMKPVELPKPKKIRPFSKNFLHFIWLQGEDELPVEDIENIREWKIQNPDWSVSLWDDESLPETIRTKAPSWLPIWQELADLREFRPDDTALIAKASDLARLILLSIRFSGDQQWNVYADTDTKPNRSLSEFLDDDTLYGGNLAKQPNFSGPITEKEWDIDKYDLLISEENLLNPNRGYLTNAVMMARPGSTAITAILKAGILTRKQPTLQAWGPIMLRKTIEALKRTPDGRRIYILPFHYFVWNPTQMREAQPNWSVCSHLNRFRWKQAGIRASVAGSARGKMSLA